MRPDDDEEKPHDIHIIACERRPVVDRDPERRYIGVRWASHPRLGFPGKGYAIFRRPVQSGRQRTPLGTFFLPSSDSWVRFAADAANRRPTVGPYFPTIEEANLGYLLPLVRLVDPRISPAELPGLVEAAAVLFGDIHEEDEELAWHIWQHAQPPPIADLVSNPSTVDRLVSFYQGQALNLLMLLALRFEYASLLGLAIDDAAPLEPVVYEVEGRWPNLLQGESDPVRTNAPCSPPPPAWVKGQRAPGSVSHPAFAAWPGWTRPAGLAPTLPDGSSLPPGASVPRSPAPFTALTWAAPPPEGTLIGYGPVLYLIRRYRHAGISPGDPVTPPLPAGAIFKPLVDGEVVIRPDTEPHYLDLPGMLWPPLEGHYHYEVRGMNLLGTVSPPARTSVRHIDDIPPPAPGARLLSEPLAVVTQANNTVSIDLAIVWDAAEDFGGPDVKDFRLDVHWVPTESFSVQIIAVAEDGPLNAQLTVASLPSPANRFAGTRLSLPLQEHQIVSHTAGSPATMVLRRYQGRLPPAPADGLILTAGVPTSRTRVARFDRRLAVPATVSGVGGLSPPTISLAQAATPTIPADDSISVYLHALRASFEAQRIPGGQWRLVEPALDRPAAAIWSQWLAMPDPAVTLTGSPAILFPHHSLKVQMMPPAGFTAGLLILSVVAADDADYLPSPARPVADPALANLTGNESSATEVVLSVRSDAPPAAPGATAWNPNRWLWTRSAAVFAESAEYQLAWAPVAGAARYEVWRALEGAIPGATPATSKYNLRNLALANADAFELRSNQVFGTSYRDSLPGRAPTRALYRVRAVNIAGVAGPPSDLIGPVNVPDIRQPPAPNLFKVGATSPDEADRSIAVEWSQSGSLEDVRFDVFFRPGDVADAGRFELASSIPRGTAPGQSGRFRFVHGGRTPGNRFTYQIFAVREARDPVDDTGAARRDITSLPSEQRSAVAFGPLAPPANLAAAFDITSSTVLLTWQNPEEYESIEIWRREDGRFRHVRAGRVAGAEQQFSDPGLAAGTWFYQLRAKGISRESRTHPDVQIVVP
jgi:hypothetical protein